MTEIRKKSDRWWYRLLQVLYTGILLAALLLTLVLVIPPAFTVNPHAGRYELVCTDGKRIGNYSGLDEVVYDLTDLSAGPLRDFARFSCSRTDLDGDALRAEYAKVKAGPKSKPEGGYTPVAERGWESYFDSVTVPGKYAEIPDIRNYHVVPLEKEYYRTWWEAVLITLVSVASIVVLATLVRAIFLYVLFKESFLGNMMSPLKRGLNRNKD